MVAGQRSSDRTHKERQAVGNLERWWWCMGRCVAAAGEPQEVTQAMVLSVCLRVIKLHF